GFSPRGGFEMSVNALTGAEDKHAAISLPGASVASGYLVVAGRALYAAIFLMASLGHFAPATIAYAAHQGVPMAGFLVPASGLLALAGGLSVLTGYRARIGAWLLVLFLVPVTIT